MIVAFCLVSGCTAVLDLDGYQDAAASLCACPGFELVSDCAAHGQSRIAAATDAERAAWLAAYDEHRCGQVCENAPTCWSELPGCKDSGPGCECCPWNGSVLSCASGDTCQPCRTCRQLAMEPESQMLECVAGRAKLETLQACACSACTADCTGFCQKIDLLTDDMMEPCRACLEQQCKSEVDTCFAEIP